MADDREDQKTDVENVKDQETGESPKSDAPTLESLQATIEDQQKHIRALNKESAERRKRLEAFEQEKADKEKAEMSEIEKANKTAADLQSQLDQIRNENAMLKLKQAFNSKVTQMDLAFQTETARDDAFRVLDVESVGDDYAGLESAIKAIVKDRPYLFGQATQTESVRDGSRKTNADLGKMTQTEIIQKKRKSYAPL